MQIFWINISKVKKKQFTTSNWINLSQLFSNDVVFSKQTYYDLYQKNGDIRQCVRKIAWSTARNGIYLQDNDRQTVEDNVVTDQVFDLFKVPTFAKFKIKFFMNYLCSWELYVKPLRNLMGETIRFDIIDSRAVTKIVKDWVITWYRVISNNGTKTETYNADEVWYFKFEDDVINTLNWMWILTSILYDAVLDLEALKTNYSFYKNSARPDMMLLLDGNLTEEEQQNAVDMFNAQFKWSENAHKTIVAWWIADVKQLSLTAKDMETISQRKMTTDKICSAFGVPKAMLWYVEDVNYNNGQNQKEEFLEWTIKPMEADFDAILNKLLQMFRPDLFEKYWIKSDSEQLKESQERLNGQRADVQTGIITINEARIDRWLEPLKDENADKPITSRNSVLLEDIALDATLPWDEY